MESTCPMAMYSPCKVFVELTNALETRTACHSLWLAKVIKALKSTFPVSLAVGRNEQLKKFFSLSSNGRAVFKGKVKHEGNRKGFDFADLIMTGGATSGAGGTV